MSAAEKPKSRRDNFTKSVIEILYKRAGGRCCRCSAATFGPVTNDLSKYRNIGQAAHIAAAAPGGPRYNARMSPEERTSASNGLWLCSNCHDVIDRDVAEFTTSVLRKLKKDGEEKAKREIGVATRGASATVSTKDALSVGVSAATIVEVRKAQAELVSGHGHPLSKEEGQRFLELTSFIDFSAHLYLPEVEGEVVPYLGALAVLCRDGEVTLEVLRRIKLIADARHAHWRKEDVQRATDIAESVVERFSRRGRVGRSVVAQSAVALLKDFSANAAIRNKKLDAIPRSALREVAVRDEVDAGPPQKRRKGEEEEEDEADSPGYLEAMQALAEAGDVERVLELEAQVAGLGYQANVI